MRPGATPHVAIVSSCALLAACAVGPAYQRPALDVPETFGAQPQQATATSFADLAWWNVYGDPALQQLLQSAMEQNRDLKIAAARVQEARALTGVSGLERWPQIDVAAAAQRGRVFQAGQYVTASQFIVQGEAAFEVDVWGRLTSLDEAARANLLATEYARAAVTVSLVSDVTTAYFTLLALDEQRRISERTVGTRTRFLDLTQSRFRRGVASELDVSRAQASLAGVRANLADLQRQIEQGENRLQILLGRNPGPIARERAELRAMPMPPEIPAGLPSSLLERRPDVREAETSLIGATADVRAVRAALFPTISLTGNFGSQSLQLSDLFAGSTRIWSFGVSLLQPLLDASRNGYQTEAARARETQAVLRYQNAVAQAFRETADALAALRSLANSRRALEEQANALRDASRRVLRRYETGYSSYFEVIDADSSLLAAELQLVQADRDHLIAMVQLYKALGGGWRS